MPEKRDRRGERDDEDNDHAGNQTPERATGGRALRQDRQNKNAQERPIEERPVPVHHFDQRSLVRRVHGHDARHQPPEQRGQLRDSQVMRVRRVPNEVPAVEIDDCRRRQRVQLATGGRHRRGENCGDHQADEPDRHARRNERREDVIDVLVELISTRLFHDCDCLRPDALHGRVALEERRPLAVRGRSAANGECRLEIALERGVVACPREQIEHEHQHAGRQDQELERDLDERAHEQRLARFVDRFRRQIPLDLALVAAEVRQHQEQPADHPGPERVRLARIEAEIDRLQAPGRSRQAQRLPERDVLYDAVHKDRHRR